MNAVADVTVVIPTRNRAALLRTTLHSIQVAADEALRAGWTTHVLVVDDCSDGTATRDVCAAAGVEWCRIEVHDGRNNPAAAIVLGVAASRSRYTMLFGDDDIMLPRHLVAHLEVTEGTYDLCSGSFHVTDAALRQLSTVVLPQPDVADLLEDRVTINDGALVRTEMFQAGPGRHPQPAGAPSSVAHADDPGRQSNHRRRTDMALPAAPDEHRTR